MPTLTGGTSPQLPPFKRALLRLVPAIVRALRQVANQAKGSSNPQLQQALAVACFSAGDALQAAAIPTPFDNGSEVAEGCAAADAALRLLPLLWQLQQGWQAQPPPITEASSGACSGQDAATVLANSCLRVWKNVVDSPLAVFQSAECEARASSLAAGGAVAEPLWQLHITSCRLAHWWASLQGGGAAVALLPAGWQVRGCEAALCNTAKMATLFNRMACDPAGGQARVDQVTRYACCLLPVACCPSPAACCLLPGAACVTAMLGSQGCKLCVASCKQPD